MPRKKVPCPQCNGPMGAESTLCRSCSSIKTVIKSCPNCGQNFEISESRMTHGRGVTCSRKCQYEQNKIKLQKPSVYKNCINCGKEMRLKECKLKHGKGAGKYCSAECKNEHRVGENHPSWQGGKNSDYGFHWQSARRSTLSRDNHTCQRCGKKENLHVHHKIPIRQFLDDHKDCANIDENLVTLCDSCHRTVESSFKFINFKPYIDNDPYEPVDFSVCAIVVANDHPLRDKIMKGEFIGDE